MRILVVGAGEVGQEVARLLSTEGHDVIVVDQDGKTLERVASRMDVLTIQGNATSAAVLNEAGVAQADMVIAVTSIDEVNIIACMMAERLGVQTTIARIRSGEFRKESAVLKASDLGISFVIHPEESTANEIVRLLRRAGATDALQLVGGRMQLIGMRIPADSPVLGKKLSEISASAPHLKFLVAGISRGIRTILPRGDQRLHRYDQIFVLVSARDSAKVSAAFGQQDVRLHHVMIFGGTSVGANVARQLSKEKGMRVKLIEPDRARAERLAEALPGVLVIHGAASDLDLLVAEGIAEMDAFVSVRPDEASNLVTSLMAKHLGVFKTVALLSNSAYIPISQRIGLDAAVNVKLSVSREVLSFLRGKHVLSVATVHGLNTEVLELMAAPRTKVTKGPLKRLRLPSGVLVGAVIHDGDIEIATGDTHIEPGDQVIVFAIPKRIREVEKLFGN